MSCAPFFEICRGHPISCVDRAAKQRGCRSVATAVAAAVRYDALRPSDVFSAPQIFFVFRKNPESDRPMVRAFLSRSRAECMLDLSINAPSECGLEDQPSLNGPRTLCCYCPEQLLNQCFAGAQQETVQNFGSSLSERNGSYCGGPTVSHEAPGWTPATKIGVPHDGYFNLLA